MALLNLENVPNNMISGLDDIMLDWVNEESNERELYELSSDFIKMLDATDDDIPDIPEDVEEEINILQKEAIPKSTLQHMEKYYERFQKFLKQKKLSLNMEIIPKNILNNYLRYFYSQLATINGKFYAPATLVCIRAGLFRYFGTQLKRTDIDIIVDPTFKGANDALKAMVFKFKRSNQPKQEDAYPAIEVDDIIKIRTYFDRSSPLILQREVAFNIIYYFNLRGRETLSFLEKSNISIETDSNAKKYLRINTDTLSKNAKVSLSAKHFEHAKQHRVYENVNDPLECPVKAFEFYLTKLEELGNERLFPKPMTKYSSSSWYCSNAVVGKNTLDTLMSILSKELHLSKNYTNHCIRVTGITVCKEQGKTNEVIATISGHKNMNSVQRYSRKRRDESHYEMSESLQMGFSKDKFKVIPVGQTGKIVVKESTSSLKNDIVVNPGQFSVHFSGNFHNCSIVMNAAEENTK